MVDIFKFSILFYFYILFLFQDNFSASDSDDTLSVLSNNYNVLPNSCSSNIELYPFDETSSEVVYSNSDSYNTAKSH
jgi:hypothetical protein